MPKISSTDATINASQDLVHALQNLEPAILIVTLGNSHKEALISLLDIFGKATSPTVLLRMPVRGAYQ